MTSLFEEILADQLEQSDYDRLPIDVLAGAWEELTGDALARHTRPTEWRGDALVVGVDSERWLDQLRSERDRVERRLDAAVPGTFDVQLVHDPRAGDTTDERNDAREFESSPSTPVGDLDGEEKSLLNDLDQKTARSLRRIRREATDPDESASE
ncbi:MAG: DciA family protein [Bradymonadaceae bacterium]